MKNNPFMKRKVFFCIARVKIVSEYFGNSLPYNYGHNI